MKRILYLSRGGFINGSQRQLYYLVGNIKQGDYEPIVVCHKNGPFVSQLRNCGIATYVFPMRPWRKFPAGLCRYLDARRLVAFAKQYQIALVHSSDLWLNGYLIWIAKKLKVPSILHVRAPVYPEKLAKHHSNKATFIIAISHRIRKNLIDAGVNPEKIVLIEDAVDLELFNAKGSQRYHQPSFQNNVLMRDFSPTGKVPVGIVGRIHPSKRQLEFLQAADKIVHQFSRSASFFVIGEISCRKYFKKLKQFVSEKRLDRCVFFTGRRDDMPQVLASLDILVTLSGGSVMFEAMACGKPIISVEPDVKKEPLHILCNRAILVDSDHSSKLVQALICLIDCPELAKQIGKEARKWAENNFSHIAMANKVQKLYDKLLAKTG